RNPKWFLEIIGFDFAQPSVYGWLSEVEASLISFRIAIAVLKSFVDCLVCGGKSQRGSLPQTI
ncbi:MAG: hypothetical protein ACKPCM_10415, partial [Pseudanabaena sp.]